MEKYSSDFDQALINCITTDLSDICIVAFPCDIVFFHKLTLLSGVYVCFL